MTAATKNVMANVKEYAAVPILIASVSATSAEGARANAIATGSFSMQTVEQELKLIFV